MTKLRVTEDIFARFPRTLIGIVILHDGNNSGEHSDVMDVLRQEQDSCRTKFANVQVTEHPQIIPWREAYRQFGAKPKDYPSSIENLIRRVVKGHSIPHINTLVDIYNAISLRHVVPVGGEDLDTIHGEVLLTFAGPDEASVKLLGEKEERPPHPGEVIYRDDNGAICRRWNWKEAERTKLTADTRNAFLVTEGLPPMDRAIIETVVQELASQVKQYCGGSVSSHLLDAGNPEIMLK